MITSEYILELSNVFHSGQVEPGTCIQKTIGTVRTGVILKDVSLEVHGGELSAILGSKGTREEALTSYRGQFILFQAAEKERFWRSSPEEPKVRPGAKYC